MSIASGNTNTDILIAGAFAAFTIDLLVYPLDTIKTRIQAPNYKSIYRTSSGAVDRALFRGLYQGIGSVILATVPSSGAFFTTYEASKSLFARLNGQLPAQYALPTPLLHSGASAVAEAVSCFILTPAEVLKQNAQMIKKPQPSVSSSTTSSNSSSNSSKNGNPTQILDKTATKRALQKFSHPSQLWRGYSALLARNLPFTAMQFPLFEGLKARLLEWRAEQRRWVSHTGGQFGIAAEKEGLLERGVVTGIAAGASGSLAAVITTPVDVVKTRIMLAAGSSAGSDVGASGNDTCKASEAKRRRGGFAIGREIWRTEGVKGLFRGGLLRGLWTALGSGLYLSVYESGRQYLEDRRKVGDDDADS